MLEIIDKRRTWSEQMYCFDLESLYQSRIIEINVVSAFSIISLHF